MPYHQPAEMTERNREIMALKAAGETDQMIADRFKITRPRVSQIVKMLAPKTPEAAQP